ncbi:MAG: hypothetical protein SFU91_01805 [Chloroherpetonaceae bacterium]|nr:hypothetical protein [Chloroherpetonaceae bacterium]
MLTAREIELLENQIFFETKVSATEKLKTLFESLRENAKLFINPIDLDFPEGTDFYKGQIAKGENYEGFPYVLLDYPKYFSQKNIFTFRTMCWFGNSWIFSVIIQGDYLAKAITRFENQFEMLQNLNCGVGVNELWNWKKDGEIILSQIEKNELIHNVKSSSFLKITKRLPLSILNSEADVLKQFKEFYSAILPILRR